MTLSHCSVDRLRLGTVSVAGSEMFTTGTDMPKGTKVDRVYQALLRQGKSKASAARIAQSQTGRSLKTGRPPKGKK